MKNKYKNRILEQNLSSIDYNDSTIYTKLSPEANEEFVVFDGQIILHKNDKYYNISIDKDEDNNYSFSTTENTNLTNPKTINGEAGFTPKIVNLISGSNYFKTLCYINKASNFISFDGNINDYIGNIEANQIMNSPLFNTIGLSEGKDIIVYRDSVLKLSKGEMESNGIKLNSSDNLELTQAKLKSIKNEIDIAQEVAEKNQELSDLKELYTLSDIIANQTSLQGANDELVSAHKLLIAQLKEKYSSYPEMQELSFDTDGKTLSQLRTVSNYINIAKDKAIENETAEINKIIKSTLLQYKIDGLEGNDFIDEFKQAYNNLGNGIELSKANFGNQTTLPLARKELLTVLTLGVNSQIIEIDALINNLSELLASNTDLENELNEIIDKLNAEKAKLKAAEASYKLGKGADQEQCASNDWKYIVGTAVGAIASPFIIKTAKAIYEKHHTKEGIADLIAYLLTTSIEEKKKKIIKKSSDCFKSTSFKDRVLKKFSKEMAKELLDKFDKQTREENIQSLISLCPKESRSELMGFVYNKTKKKYNLAKEEEEKKKKKSTKIHNTNKKSNREPNENNEQILSPEMILKNFEDLLKRNNLVVSGRTLELLYPESDELQNTLLKHLDIEEDNLELKLYNDLIKQEEVTRIGYANYSTILEKYNCPNSLPGILETYKESIKTSGGDKPAQHERFKSVLLNRIQTSILYKKTETKNFNEKQITKEELKENQETILNKLSVKNKKTVENFLNELAKLREEEKAAENQDDKYVKAVSRYTLIEDFIKENENDGIIDSNKLFTLIAVDLPSYYEIKEKFNPQSNDRSNLEKIKKHEHFAQNQKEYYGWTPEESLAKKFSHLTFKGEGNDRYDIENNAMYELALHSRSKKEKKEIIERLIASMESGQTIYIALGDGVYSEPVVFKKSEDGIVTARVSKNFTEIPLNEILSAAMGGSGIESDLNINIYHNGDCSFETQVALMCHKEGRINLYKGLFPNKESTRAVRRYVREKGISGIDGLQSMFTDKALKAACLIEERKEGNNEAVLERLKQAVIGQIEQFSYAVNKEAIKDIQGLSDTKETFIKNFDACETNDEKVSYAAYIIDLLKLELKEVDKKKAGDIIEGFERINNPRKNNTLTEFKSEHFNTYFSAFEGKPMKKVQKDIFNSNENFENICNILYNLKNWNFYRGSIAMGDEQKALNKAIGNSPKDMQETFQKLMPIATKKNIGLIAYSLHFLYTNKKGKITRKDIFDKIDEIKKQKHTKNVSSIEENYKEPVKQQQQSQPNYSQQQNNNIDQSVLNNHSTLALDDNITINKNSRAQLFEKKQGDEKSKPTTKYNKFTLYK